MKDALTHKIEAAEEPISVALRRLKGVRNSRPDGADSTALDHALELLGQARSALEVAAKYENGCVCSRCQGYYTEDELEVDIVPQWGGKTFLSCPHCGEHKKRID